MNKYLFLGQLNINNECRNNKSKFHCILKSPIGKTAAAVGGYRMIYLDKQNMLQRER